MFVQLFCKWSSACERMPLSADCRACKSWVSSACISGDRRDMVATWALAQRKEASPTVYGGPMRRGGRDKTT